MNMRRVVIVFCLLAAVGALAQWRYRGGGRFEQAQTARDMTQHTGETPTWTNTPGFEHDTFTFVRIRRDSGGYSGGPWWTDAPDSDLNLSYRLQQMTALKVNPNGLFLRLTDRALADYPFIYIVEPGSLYLSEEEVKALRDYLLNGGFLWLDDFWGEEEWENVEYELKRVFPNRSFVEMPLTNQLYRCVFDITAKRQIPAVELGTRSQSDPERRTWERYDAKQVHHRAIFDDKGRLMVFATHNTDNGDGWEWEGDNLFYFREFAEKTAYPLAVNVVFYVMTH